MFPNVNRPQGYTCLRPPDLPPHLPPSRLSQSTGLSSPGHTAKSHLLSILHMVNVHVSMLVSLFRCRPVFKVFNWIYCNIGYVLYFGFFFGPKAYGILDSWPGTETMPSPLEGKVLTTGLPEKSLFSLFKTGSWLYVLFIIKGGGARKSPPGLWF